MELVYLWIEKYKNIENQGFNFSPRFTCKYENDELTIEPKEHHSIFPDNINVTAIVGENGSGKSNLIGILIKLFQKINKNFYPQESIIVLLKIKDMFYALYTTSTLRIECSHSYKTIKYPNDLNDKKNIGNDILNLFKSFYYSLYDYLLEENNNSISYDEYIYPNKTLSIDKIENVNKRIFRHLFLKCAHEKYFGAYFVPDALIIRSNELYNPRINKSISKKNFQNIAKLSDDLDSFDNVHKFLFIIYTYLGSLLFQFHPNDTFEELREVNTMKEFEDVLHKKITQLYKYYTESNFAKAQSFSYQEDLIKIINIFKYTKIVKKLKEKLKSPLNTTNSISGLYNGIELHIDKKFIEDTAIYNFLFDNLPNCFELDYINVQSGIKYLDLSSGEKSLLRIWAYIESKIKSIDKTNFLFLFDELDIEIHPQWQKEIIKYILQILKNQQEKQFHIIITSHSPFLLSDIPKENVIFLEKGKQVYPNIETFGANIHTLLSHGFFMKEGLMGEFAKNKINEVIDYLNGKTSPIENDDEVQRYIRIIGEPILKRQLQKMLDSKHLSEIEKIKKQITELQKKLEKHQHAQD